MIPSILSVLDELGISHPIDKSNFYINCMFCNDENKHLNISTQKNVWRCPRCGEHGGSLALYAKIKNISVKEVEQHFFELSNNGGKNKVKPIIGYNRDEVKIASLPKVLNECLNQVYRALLNKLTLHGCDKQELLRRGLSEKQIRLMQFKSVSVEKDYEIAKQLIEQGLCLKNIAGFAKYNGDWFFKAPYDGILIPYANADKQITAFQIRQKQTVTKRKYVWLSTEYLNEKYGYSCGSSAQTTAHLVGWRDGTKAVCLTEGALKGDIAYHLSNLMYGKSLPYLCIAGVNNTSNLTQTLEILKERGVTKIYNCLDMDRDEKTIIYNPHVGKASTQAVKLMCDMGFNVVEKYWDSKYKGIDDYLKSIYDNSRAAA